MFARAASAGAPGIGSVGGASSRGGSADVKVCLFVVCP